MTNLSFSIDGKVAGSYVHTPSDQALFQYNVAVFTSATLNNGSHTLIMSTVGEPTSNPNDSSHNSFVIFDYAEYT